MIASRGEETLHQQEYWRLMGAYPDRWRLNPARGPCGLNGSKISVSSNF